MNFIVSSIIENVLRATLLLFCMALWDLLVNTLGFCFEFTDKNFNYEESLRGLYDKWELQHYSTRSLDLDEIYPHNYYADMTYSIYLMWFIMSKGVFYKFGERFTLIAISSLLTHGS